MPPSRSRPVLATALALASLVGVACGDGGDDPGAGAGTAEEAGAPGAGEVTAAERAAFELDVRNVVADGGQDATLAVAGDVVLLTWGEVGTSGEPSDERDHVRDDTGGGVFVTRSTDGGATFGDPVRIDTDDPAADEGFSTSTRNDRPPRIVAAPDGSVHVLWIVTAQREGERYPAADLRIATSTDGGETFSDPAPVVDAALSPGFFNGLVSAEGNLHVGFLTSSEEEDAVGSAVRVATSTDGGETFEVSDEFTSGEVCQCCPVSLAEHGDGTLALGWRHIEPQGDSMWRDHVVAFSDDEGATWSSWEKIADDEWLVPQCPHSGSAIAYDADDRLHAAWYTGKEEAPGVYYTRTEAAEADFGDPVTLLADDFFPIVEPSLVVTPDDTVWVAFGDEREDTPAVWLARIDPDGTATLSDEPVAEGRYPRLAVAGDDVLLTWEHDGAVDVAGVPTS